MSNSTQDRNFWVIISIAVVCGLAAGILGEIITRVYILKDFSSTFSGEVNLSNLNTNNSGLIIRDAKKVVVNQDVKIAETLANIRPVLVGVFKAIATTSPAVNSQKPDYYKLDEPLFTGLIITSDGWVVALLPSDLKKDFKFKNYVAIGYDRQSYKIDQVADLKTVGDLLIFHLAGAANLPVKKIVPRSELTLGETLLSINSGKAVQPTTLTSLIKTPTVLSSDFLNARLDLAAFDDRLKNSFVFDLAGNLVAIVFDNKEVTPAFSYNSVWLALASGNKLYRPYLGLNYLDLSTVKITALNLDKGAWLYPSPTQPAVIKDSPAQLLGLKAGDVVTWVNNQEINASNDLADLISTYQPGETITLTYWRAGVEKSGEVKLGQLK